MNQGKKLLQIRELQLIYLPESSTVLVPGIKTKAREWCAMSSIRSDENQETGSTTHKLHGSLAVFIPSQLGICGGALASIKARTHTAW